MTMKMPFAKLAALAIALTLVASGSQGERELPTVRPGEELDVAKDFRLADLHGVRMRLSETDASVIVLHFWTTYRDCAYDLGALERIHEKYAGEDVKIIGLVYNSGTREEVESFLGDLGVEFPTLMCSSEVRDAYHVSTFPTTFLLDGKKQIRYWMYGHLVEKHWSQLVAELLDEAGEPRAS